MADPPLRVLLGHGAVESVQGEYAKRLEGWGSTRELTERADSL